MKLEITKDRFGYSKIFLSCGDGFGMVTLCPPESESKYIEEAKEKAEKHK